MENKMSYEEFKEQEEYCRRPGQVGGQDCTGCPGEHSICADNIRNLFGKMADEMLPKIKAIAKSNIRQYHYEEANCDTAACWTAEEVVDAIKRGSTEVHEV